MDFFASEDRARAATRRLVAAFILCVVLMVSAIAATAWAFAGMEPDIAPHRIAIAAWAAAATLAAVLLGSAWKVHSLARGGEAVASLIGARPLPASPVDAHERQLRNVVEEMAIASGTPMPAVYVLDDDGMNAFAAGHGAGDAAVVVTRGCLRRLSRDELQGVVAHEFSHLLNADTRLNLRLIGLVHGLLVVALAGRLLLRAAGRSRSSSRKGNGAVAAILLVGLALMVIGYVGWFFGQLLKAGVSRQREFLADASAVQFTRNPQGIGGALKKIGGAGDRSLVAGDRSEELSHLFFARAVHAPLFGLLATHPPLEERVRAIDAGWDGRWPVLEPVAPIVTPPAPTPRVATGGESSSGAGAIAADDVAARVGRIGPEHVAYGAALLAELPAELAAAARDPYSARAVAIAAVLAAGPDRAPVQAAAVAAGDAALGRELERIRPAVAALGEGGRLPLIDVALTALRSLSAPQRAAFANSLATLEGSAEPTLAQLALARVLLVHLAPSRTPPHGGIMAVAPLLPSLSTLLAELARSGGHDAAQARAAFAAAAARLVGSGQTLAMSATPATPAAIDAALAQLAQASPGLKRRILTACAWCVANDGRVTVREAELLRAVADALGCPLPPFVDRA